MHYKMKFIQRPIGYGIAIASLFWSILVFFLGFYIQNEEGYSWWIFAGLVIIWLIIIVLLFILDNKNRQINHLQDQIKQGVFDLIHSYEQLSNLEKAKKYLEFFKQFVRYDEYVIGVQTYNYYLSSSNGRTSIKIEYENGYVEDTHDINAIIQSSYKFNKRDIVTLRKSIYKHRLLDKLSSLESFFFRKLEYLSSPEDYALLSLAQRELSDALDIDMGLLPLSKDKSQKNNLLSQKRLGIAKAILTYEYLNLSTYYGFSYRGKSNSKGNRHYLSYIVESSTGTKKLYLIVYQSEPYHNIDDIIALENQIINSFKNLLDTNKLVERAEDLDNKKRRDFHAFIQKLKQNF